LQKLAARNQNSPAGMRSPARTQSQPVANQSISGMISMWLKR
jgi:hypothetical protein